MFATQPKLTLLALQESFAICRLERSAPPGDWLAGEGFYSITRTRDELSVVCAEGDAPEGERCEKGWRCLKVEGPLDFSLVGILSSIARPLAEAGVSIFSISTFDTDYVFIKDSDFDKAIETLAGAGHLIL